MRMRAVLFASAFVVLVGCGRGAPADDTLDEAAAKAPSSAVLAGEAKTAAPVATLAVSRTPAAPRMMVRDAELALRVKEVRAAERRIGEIARRVGGEVEASQGSDLAGPTPNLASPCAFPKAASRPRS